MLKQVDEWGKENNHSSQKFVQNLKNKLSETQEKLNKLVSAYIDGDIPKESYLAKKEELLKQKVSLVNNLEDFGQTGKNWLQPLRAWILDTKKAKNLASSENYEEMKRFVQKVGTNPKFLDKSISFSFLPPWDFLALRLAQSPNADGRCPEANTPKNNESFDWWCLLEKVRTHFRQNPD
jgi:hypothetical protein